MNKNYIRSSCKSYASISAFGLGAEARKAPSGKDSSKSGYTSLKKKAEAGDENFSDVLSRKLKSA